MKNKILRFIFIAFFVSLLPLFGESVNLPNSANSENLADIDKYINSNPWIIKYNNYAEYNNINNTILEIEEQIANLERAVPKDIKQIANLNKKLQSLKRQEELLQSYKSEPYKELMNSKELESTPNITNPFLIPSGFSYIKGVKQQITNIDDNYNSLTILLDTLHRKMEILRSINATPSEIAAVKSVFDDLESMHKILAMYMEIFKNNAQNNIKIVDDEIRSEIVKLVYIIASIAIISLLSFLFKLSLRIYVLRDDVEKSYTINKLINVLNITIIVCILIFAYIENVTYIIAIIGFVSAGLAIAMKDWFMSFFGWMIIMGGGSIKAGDRIRIVKDNTTYVGDVIDISMLKITLYEDVTYATYTENRRAGRIIFIPNNLIFSTMIANYSHSNMKTIWDGVDITITFNSNYKKALKIASDIAKKYSLGHTETARRQLNKLKVKYSLHDVNIEPRVFSFVVPNGIRISVWFQANSHATLMSNSIISGAIVESFNKESDIEISYPTTTIIAKDRNLSDGGFNTLMQDSKDSSGDSTL